MAGSQGPVGIFRMLSWKTRPADSARFTPENHRAHMMGLLKEELNCKKCLAACLHSPTTRFLPPLGRQISAACFIYCMFVLQVCV